VIALGAGGVLETVRAGETGVYYEPGDAIALAEAVAGFDPLAVDPEACVAAARRFGLPRFQHTFRDLVTETVAAARPPAAPRRVAAG
jgi:glycosyltransferase involved in cell wall biosynthesis